MCSLTIRAAEVFALTDSNSIESKVPPMMRSLGAAAEEKCTFVFLLSYVLCLIYVFIGLDIWTEKKIQKMQMCIV